MKVLWFTNIIMPEFAREIGCVATNQGGWMPALLKTLHAHCPEMEIHIASEGPSGQRAIIDGVHYYALGRGRSRRTHRLLPMFQRAVAECINEVSPDVVHIHGTEGPFAALPVNIWKGQRLVVSLQGIISALATHYYGSLSDDELAPYRNRLRELLRGYSVKEEMLYWKGMRSSEEARLMQSADMLLGRTAWDRAWSEKITAGVMYATVGEIMRDEFYGGMRQSDNVVPHSIYCGSAFSYPLKNGHVLLEAIATLKAKYPDIKLHVANARSVAQVPGMIGGLREGEYVRYVRHRIAELGLGQHVVCHDAMTSAEVRMQLESADLFCLPSACENSPNSLGEAMLTGTPCVATFVGGVPSVLDNGKEGILVPSNDPAMMASAIDRLFMDGALARGFANEAYQSAVVRYSPTRVVTQLFNAYNEVCHDH